MTGCNDKHYQLGLLAGLLRHDVEVDFIANDDMKDASHYEQVNYFNLRGDQNPSAPIQEKILRILKFYYKLILYALRSDAKIFHIQWLNKFIIFDRTFLNLYYKILGKKLVLTAHNINDRERDGGNTLINRLSLKFMYNVMDHIIVHTEKMKKQLVDCFNISEKKISVIPHGIHDAVIQTEMTREQARKKLYVERNKVILFFGNIAPYKGLEYGVEALKHVKNKYADVKLIIAGKAKNNEIYWKAIEKVITDHGLDQHVLKCIEFIPDEDIEVYYKAADLSILPYTYVFQSGVLFMSYNFGIPVIATDVGSLKEEIIEGKTGFVCRPRDVADLVEKIDAFFSSDLYKNLNQNKSGIIAYAKEKYSWVNIGEKTIVIYSNMLAGSPTNSRDSI